MEDTALDKETLITLTADIVSAHVSNNNVSVDEVSGLISNVHAALSSLAGDSAAEARPGFGEERSSCLSGLRPENEDAEAPSIDRA